MASRKRKRVPEVLWRLFGNRARTLADTILALIPPPPAACASCKGRRCLYCRGAKAMSFLVRSTDSADYRKLLSQCFVVVAEDAPPAPAFGPHCHWSQPEIVRRLIEIILREQPSSSNLICCSYDKESRSSPAVDELTSSKWNVLLRRVGDALMMYLLKYTSIFVPLPRRKHHQISGCPISSLSSKFSGRMPNYRPQHHPIAYKGHNVKRQRVEEPRKQLLPCTLGYEPSSNSAGFATSNGSSNVSEELPRIQREGNSKQNTVMWKRKRDYGKQRRRKHRQLAVRGMPCRGNSSTSDNLSLISSSSRNDICSMTHCFCCSVFQNQPSMKGNSEIDRKFIFYRIENCSSMLPRKHMLYTVKPNGLGASILFNTIFETFGPDKNAGIIPCHIKIDCPVNSICLYHSLIKLLKILIRKSQNCRHVRLLEKHCSVRSSYQDASRGAGTTLEVAMAKNLTKIPETNTPPVEPIMCCLKNQVVSFIWAICRRIVPSPLLGEQSNRRSLRRNISKFIGLRRFEKFSLKECIYRLKISKFPIFPNEQNGCSELGITDIARHAILECWIFWFFEHIVSPLVKANFYVTESQHEKQEVLYYRKSTWEKLMRENECMTDTRYLPLNHTSARNILGKRSFGFSRARLLPKSKGFRVLANLRRPSRFPVETPSKIHCKQKSWKKASGNHRVEYRFYKSVNSVLHDVHAVLAGLRAKEPEKMGSSVFDYNDVYKKLVPFLFHLKKGSASLPNVFMVVSDVSRAFDSINHEKLLGVMKDVICDHEFTLEKFTQVVSTSKCLKIDPHVMLAHPDIRTASTRIRSRVRVQSLDSIVVKKELCRQIGKEEINCLLKEHITRNVVQLRNKFYLQQVGIPQGSVLSALLCSYYYGHMERNVVLPFLEKAKKIMLAKYHSSGDTPASGGNHKTEISTPNCENLLLRFVDDFLFISASKIEASMFFTRMDRGVRDYNCSMNKEKYGLNFAMDNRQVDQPYRLHIDKENVSFLRWSGLLINCSTLEIQADYSRYLNYHLSSTLTVCRQGKVGKSLKEKLRSYLRPKCHPIFYDSNINSPGVVRLNIYQAFLLSAMKFICHLSNLSILPKFHPKFCLKVMETSLRYMNRLMKRRIYSFKGVRPKYEVKKKEVMWLGLYAYRRVLLKKHSRHKRLLRLLRVKLKAYEEVESMPSELKYAVADEHSSVLWNIKF